VDRTRREPVEAEEAGGGVVRDGAARPGRQQRREGTPVPRELVAGHEQHAAAYSLEAPAPHAPRDLR
jgi:hypothetical protein